jgi:hypothetical protein
MNKNSRRIVAIVLLAAFGLWLVFTVFPFGGPEGSSNERVNRPAKVYEPKFKHEANLAFISATAHDTVKQIQIELAESAEEIQYGMMYRKSMDPNTGMLFLMPNEENQSFWMKNTYVSLDIIYINSSNEIVSIQKNAVPLSETSLPSAGPASMVLEVAGGFTDTHGIAAGTKIAFSRIQ